MWMQMRMVDVDGGNNSNELEALAFAMGGTYCTLGTLPSGIFPFPSDERWGAGALGAAGLWALKEGTDADH
jgi:hypothetical protein